LWLIDAPVSDLAALKAMRLKENGKSAVDLPHDNGR
jgi:hypothetical protein